MKRKIISIICIIAIVLIAALPVSGVKEQKTPEYNGKKAQIMQFADETQYLSSLTVAAEDDKAILLFDTDTANIAFKNKADNSVLFSAPVVKAEYASVLPAQQQLLLSPVILSYTDDNLKKYTLSSFADCAAYGQLKSKKTDNGVIFTMTLGKLAASEIVAEVLTVETAEKLEKLLDEKDYKYLIQSYRKVTLKGDHTDSAMLSDYPILKEQEFFYSLRTNISEGIKKKLAQIFALADYTRKQLEADEVAVYGKLKSAEEQTANFTLDLEYTLDNGHLVVNVSVDKIIYDKDKFKLVELEVLRYFGADGLSDNGFFLLPDGSGTVAEYSAGVKGNGSPITIDLYGNDAAYRYDSTDEFVKNGLVPVYGQNNGETSYIAIAENGDAQAVVSSVIDESEIGLRYTNFVCKTRLTEKYVHSERASYDEFIRSSVNCYEGDYTVRYIPVNGNSYSSMATVYREYLAKKGILKNTAAKNNGLHLELLGAVESRHNGAFADSKVFALTTFEDTEKIIKELEEVGKLSIKLKGFANGGLDNTVFSKVKVSSELGGKKALQKLLSNAKASIYPAIDISYVYRDKNFDGFSASNNAAHRLDNSYAHIYPYNLGSSLGDYSRSFYAVKSSSMKQYNNNLLKNLDFGVKGISYENIGSVLNSDSSKKSGSRTDAMKDYIEILDKASKKYSLELEGGNLYTYRYADAIRNLDSSDSGFRNSTYSVPFVQMLLHGSIPYSSSALNLVENYESSFLKAIENGEQLSYTLAYRNLNKLTQSVHTEYNSVDFGYWKDIIKQDSKKADDLLKGTYDKKISEHKYLTDDVVSVAYENGVKILVNYSYDDYTADGVTVKARDAVRIEN